MRRASLLPLAMTVLAGAVAYLYYERRSAQQREAPAPPTPLPARLSAAASNWEWSYSEGRPCPSVSVRARSFRQIREPSRFELEDVELRLYQKDCSRVDLVTGHRAEFDTERGVLYSQGDVDVLLGLPATGAPAGRHFRIRSSGVTLESKTGKVTTDRATTFEFAGGRGSCVGAAYDPGARELHLRSAAEVSWQSGPGEPVLTVQAGEMLYKERDSAILLYPWSRFRRGPMEIEAGQAIVWLEEHALRRVEARDARGRDVQGSRLLEYAAGLVFVHWSRNGQIERIEAEQHARLLSRDGAAQTAVAAGRIEMHYRAAGKDQELSSVWARGRVIVESQAPARGEPAPDKRVLESEAVHLAMRAGGREIDAIETHAPGRMAFQPASPYQRRRTLAGERLRIYYGADNRVRALEADGAFTQSDPPETPVRAPAPPPARTWSRRLRAEFAPGTQALRSLVQEGEFRYEEGERKGRAERAVLEAAEDRILLEGSARLWDPAGTLAAGRILLDQRTGDTVAEGGVTASRLPERKKPAAPGLLDPEDGFQAQADRMTTADRNRVLRYEGRAVVWQGTNRIRAQFIEIDRRTRALVARGSVVAQFAETPPRKDGPGLPALVVIEAPELVYNDATRVAAFSGGIRMVRRQTTVTAARLIAHLAQGNGSSRLERADAEGAVEIVQAAGDRLRRASAEHAAYEADEEKIVLWGGEPVFQDSLRGATRGRQLTWFPDDDRLLVEGGAERPAVSRIRKK
jgi:lipopolysaccharide export system protein LptA